MSSRHQSDIDKVDLRILGALQKDAQATLSDVAKETHLSISQTQRRIKQLEEADVIQGYTATIDAVAVGLEVVAYVEVTLNNQDTESASRFHTAVNKIADIVECHRISGEADYLLKVFAPDLKGYSRLAQETLMAIPEIDRLISKIVFESPKTGSIVPLNYALP